MVKMSLPPQKYFPNKQNRRRRIWLRPVSMAFPGDTERSSADAGGLEASLLHLVHDHHHASLKLREASDNAKKDAIRNASRVSQLLVDAVNCGVQESFIIEKRIELEIRALGAAITRFMKQTDQWLASTHALNTAVKELGDFENWMKTMEFDCKSINAAIGDICQP